MSRNSDPITVPVILLPIPYNSRQTQHVTINLRTLNSHPET